MSTSRYDNREIFFNDDPLFKRHFKQRKIGGIVQYDTPLFPEIEDEEYKNIETVQHLWKLGDRYSKLAEFYYDDPTMWWLIAFYNKKPTESHLKIGDLVFIPTPLEAALEVIGM